MSDCRKPTLNVNQSNYEETQLADIEIVERETVRQAWAEYHARRERERLKRMTSFRWNGGMC